MQELVVNTLVQYMSLHADASSYISAETVAKCVVNALS